jgi:hypothetical protein
MGILSDYFIASDSEIEAFDQRVPDAWPTVEGKGFGLMPLRGLAKELGVDALEDGEPKIHGESFEWFVQKLLPPFVVALAKLTPAEIEKHSVLLSKHESAKGMPAHAKRFLDGLVGLAKKAGTKKSVYVYTST